MGMLPAATSTECQPHPNRSRGLPMPSAVEIRSVPAARTQALKEESTMWPNWRYHIPMQQRITTREECIEDSSGFCQHFRRTCHVALVQTRKPR